MYYYVGFSKGYYTFYNTFTQLDLCWWRSFGDNNSRAGAGGGGSGEAEGSGNDPSAAAPAYWNGVDYVSHH